jgi:cytochrome c oxidase subunit 2
MNTSLPLLPERASTMADKFEWLFWYITIATAAGTLLVCLALTIFCIKYRRGATTGSTPRILGSHALELGWTITPLLIFLTFYAWGAKVYDYVVHPPEDAMEIYVIGKQWMWKAQYPNGQRVIIGANDPNMEEPGWKNIGRLVLPIDRPVKLTFISEDVIHDFGVPAFRTKIDVLPGRYVSTWYLPNRLGEYTVFCDQYCGTWHSKMVGKIAVVSQGEFEAFLRGENSAQGPGTKHAVDGSLAWEGQQLFRKLQCSECHTNDTHARAPNLEELFGSKVTLETGETVVADEDYIIESILRPRAKVVQGWKPIMPHYEGQVSAEDLNKVVAYIKSLRRGGTIKKNENFPPPVGAPTQPQAPSGSKP